MFIFRPCSGFCEENESILDDGAHFQHGNNDDEGLQEDGPQRQQEKSEEHCDHKVSSNKETSNGKTAECKTFEDNAKYREFVEDCIDGNTDTTEASSKVVLSNETVNAFEDDDNGGDIAADAAMDCDEEGNIDTTSGVTSDVDGGNVDSDCDNDLIGDDRSNGDVEDNDINADPDWLIVDGVVHKQRGRTACLQTKNKDGTRNGRKRTITEDMNFSETENIANKIIHKKKGKKKKKKLTIPRKYIRHATFGKCCIYCEKGKHSNSSATLVDHMLQFHPEKCYKCPVCKPDRIFCYLPYLEDHVLWEHISGNHPQSMYNTNSKKLMTLSEVTRISPSTIGKDDTKDDTATNSTSANSTTSVLEDVTSTSNISVLEDVTSTSNTSVLEDVTSTSNTSVLEDVTATSNTSVLEDITVTSNTSVSKDVTSTSNTSVSNDITSTNNTSVLEDVTATSNTSVSKDVTATSNMSVSIEVTANSTTSVLEDVTATSNISVLEDVTSTSNISVSKDVTATSNTSVSNDVTVTVTGSTSVSKDVTVTSSMFVSKDITLTSSTSDSQDVTVTGSTSTLTDNSPTSSASVSKDVIATSDTSISKDVTATSNTSVSNDVTATSNTSISNDITSTSNTSVSKDVTVTGSTLTLTDNSATSSASVSKDVTATSNTYVTPTSSTSASKDGTPTNSISVSKYVTVTSNTSISELGKDTNIEKLEPCRISHSNLSKHIICKSQEEKSLLGNITKDHPVEKPTVHSTHLSVLNESDETKYGKAFKNARKKYSWLPKDQFNKLFHGAISDQRENISNDGDCIQEQQQAQQTDTTRKDDKKVEDTASHGGCDLETRTASPVDYPMFPAKRGLTNLHNNNIDDLMFNATGATRELRKQMQMTKKISYCKLCKSAMNPQKSLYRHAVVFHYNLLPKCLWCGQTFYFVYDLEQHTRNVHDTTKVYSCPVCYHEFGCYYLLRDHINDKHLRSKSYLCHLCGKSFGTAPKLKTHTYIKHPQKEPVQCSQCDYSTNKSILLRNHVRNCHLKIPHQIQICNICGKQYSQKASLNRHLKIHSGVKKHVCNTCGLSFVQKCTLDRHLLTHDGVRFICPLCSDTKFCQDHLLRSHMRKEHHSDAKSIAKAIKACV